MDIFYLTLIILQHCYICFSLNNSALEYDMIYGQNDKKIKNSLVRIQQDFGGFSRHKRFYSSSPEFLYIESRDSLVIGASLNIHHSSPKNPLQCGPIDAMHGIQHVEAFLWAYDMIRAHPDILPGVELGAIILDTCSSHQKTARDVSNFFSNSFAGEEHPNLPAAESVVGYIVDGDNSKIVDAVVDVTNPFEITTMASLTRDSKYNDREDYPLLLRLSTPNDVYADAIISILIRFLWHYVSVVYESTPQMIDIFHELKIKSNFLSIEYAMEEEIGSNNIYGNHILSIINKIKRNAKNGSKVVILLMSNEQIRRLFQENSNLPKEHQLAIGEVQWISIEGKEVFPDFTDQTLGVITIGQQLQSSSAFKSYFTGLSLRNNTRNPWFNEYWEVLFNCRSNQCLNPSVSSHIPSDIAIDRDTSQTINAMFSLANALELTRRALCPELAQGLCPEFRRNAKVSKVIYDMAKSSSFRAFDNRQMVFDPESGYAISSLFIHNLRMMSQKSLIWHNVGIFTVHDGLYINVTKARAYNSSGDEIPLSQVKSVCSDNHCTQLIPESTAIQPSMTIPPIGGLTIGAIIPLHKPGSGQDMFNCGLIDEEMFENLLAFNYALEIVNKNHSILPNIQLGAVVFDDCGQKDRAQERLLSFLSTTDGTKIPAKTLVSMITFNENSTQEVQHILDEHKIVHLRAPVAQPTDNQNSLLMKSSPVKKHEIQTIVNLLTKFEWSLVNLIYSDENLKNIFVIQSNKMKVCVDFMFALSEDMTKEEVKKDLNLITNKSESKVIVVLGNPKINSLVLSSASDNLLKNYIWIGGQTWRETLNKSDSMNLTINSLSLSLESYNDPNFLKYLSSLSMIDHNSIPVNWFHQYYQQKFSCHLVHSPVIDTRFDSSCTGDERLEHMDGIHSDNIYYIIGLVNGIINGIKKLINEKCQLNLPLEDIDKCPDNPREQLKSFIQNELEINSKDKQNRISNSIYSFNIWKKTNGNEIKMIGVSRDNTIELKKKITDLSPIKAYCVRNCRKCETQFETSSQQLLLSERMPPMVVTLRRTWSLFASILSGMGVISVLICVIYFLLVFPLAIGTTALGYQILFGLFLAFSTNFVFLIPVSMTVCALRRLGLSLSYTIIISGLLVKVLNTWRLMIIKNNSQPLRLSSPLALVFISTGLVLLQLILTTIWLISYSPNPGLYDGLWKCSPNKSFVLFDSEIIVSLLYIIQLLLITIFFAALTWKCYDQNREPRWIMGCAVSTSLIWLCWIILSVGSADTTMSIVCANLINSSLIMILLYIRKLYLFTKISRQIRKERKMKNSLQHEPFAGHQQFYGAVKSSSISGQIDWNDREVMANQLRGATRPPFEGDYDDNISSCGSVKSSASAQVQCHDLYPMEVYDGGSQFAPLSSLFSQSNKSVYGLRDDNNTTQFT